MPALKSSRPTRKRVTAARGCPGAPNGTLPFNLTLCGCVGKRASAPAGFFVAARCVQGVHTGCSLDAHRKVPCASGVHLMCTPCTRRGERQALKITVGRKRAGLRTGRKASALAA